MHAYMYVFMDDVWMHSVHFKSKYVYILLACMEYIEKDILNAIFMIVLLFETSFVQKFFLIELTILSEYSIKYK
jgi:hypothetical protein